MEYTTSKFSDLLASYLGEYDEAFCKQNSLFLSYDADGKLAHVTRPVVKLQEEIIGTDLNFILGEYQTISAEQETPELDDILARSEWDKIKRLAIMQGLILGTTALKVGRDDEGKVKIGLVRLTQDYLYPKKEKGEIVEWRLLSGGVEEIFTKDRYTRSGNNPMNVPNQYKRFWIFVIQNRPSLLGDWQGESEWETIEPLINEINSIQSRISRIEDIYANPKVLVTGSDKASFSKDDNVWFIRDAQGSISILEYRGDIMTTMQNRVNFLLDVLKMKCPELMINDLGPVSGYALKLKMQRLIKKIGQLKETYFRAFEDVLSLAYEMETGKKVEFTIVSDLTIPADTQTLITEMVTLNSMDIVSRRTIAEELGYNFDEEQERLSEESKFFEVSDELRPTDNANPEQNT